jgi:hypothetical protein
MTKSCVVALPFDCFETKYDEEGNPVGFKPPSCWYILNAMGEYIFIKKQSRKDAQEIVDKIYWKEKYIVRAAYNKAQKKTFTVKGR